MKFNFVVTLTLMATCLQAQTNRRQATIVGAGGERGRCVVEIVVDGAAEVAIRGDDATVNNLRGQPPEIRRFECNRPMPPDPIEFHFAPVGGRGRQELIRPAVHGGPAVIRIEDPQNGSDRYVFELAWRNQGPPPMSDRRDDRDGREGRGRRERFTTEEAVRVCRDSVRHQIADRFHTDDINFRETRLDDAPGRNDWVIGTVDVRRRDGDRGGLMRFSCSVDFETGRVRSAQVDPERR